MAQPRSATLGWRIIGRPTLKGLNNKAAIVEPFQGSGGSFSTVTQGDGGARKARVTLPWATMCNTFGGSWMPKPSLPDQPQRRSGTLIVNLPRHSSIAGVASLRSLIRPTRLIRWASETQRWKQQIVPEDH